MKAKGIIVLMALLAVTLAAGTVFAGGATRVQGAIWADGELYDTVITPATFVAPPEHSTDVIYSFMMSGLMGQRAVSDSAPGDRDYNGGRWDVQAVTFTALGISVLDGNGDGYVDTELTSEAEVLDHESMGYLTITEANFYFECPLLPRRGR
jgi:hypothetical protein